MLLGFLIGLLIASVYLLLRSSQPLDMDRNLTDRSYEHVGATNRILVITRMIAVTLFLATAGALIGEVSKFY